MSGVALWLLLTALEI